MLKVENVQVWGFEHAIRGMRNPLQSHSKSDSGLRASGEHFENVDFVIGPNDLELMKKLTKAGSEHRKCLRQIFVSMDVTAPFFVWKQIDTYKVGTVANSCSTMHKLTAKEFSIEDFTVDGMSPAGVLWLKNVVDGLNQARELYLESKSENLWRDMVCMLPESYNQRRTMTMNYENVLNIIHQRSNHKLSEWHTFCDALKRLPYIKELIE